MKKLERLKLDQLNKNALDAKQQNALKGGVCYCTCSGCFCKTWDGTGAMPPSQSSNDMGLGNAKGYTGSSVGSWK